MLVLGAGQKQYTVFVPVETLQQQEAARRLKTTLLGELTGVTDIPAQGYWNPPNGVTLSEVGRAYVLIVTDEQEQFVRECVKDYAEYSGEQQVLMTRNNVDVFYFNKEQQ